MINYLRAISLSFFLFLFADQLYATIRLPGIIGSHMVLPQNREVTIWGWGNPNEAVKVKVEWDTAVYTAITNFRSVKWEVIIKTPAAGGPYKIVISGENEIILNDVMLGEVWLCGGQSNMELSANDGIKQAQDEAPNASNPMIRFFYVPKSSSAYPQDDTKGKWVVCNPEDMKKFSAVGYFFGKKLHQELHQPIGLINANWGGTGAEIWSPAELINNNPSFKEVAEMAAATNDCCPNGIGLLFNGMIHPIINFKISGVVWYQGETNRFSYAAYPSLLKSMVSEWRRLWKYDFPFYYVQIAPFSDFGIKNYVALMRDAQTKCLAIPKSGMVVISDLVDDINNVHPQNKLDVGLRLANYALAETYDKKGISYKSPLYKSIDIQKDKIRISFDNAASGLMSRGGEPTDFFISGEDKNFMPAVAVIDGSNIIVSNKKVKKPVAVRFGFSNQSLPNLFNKEGLPVNLFRTDLWEIPTEPIIKKKSVTAVGAIRWDGWHGKKDGVNEVMEKTLAPKQFHERLPFFAEVVNDSTVRIDGSSQQVMDKEIEYAKYAGLDYWAFVLYAEKNMLSLGLKTYLQSRHQKDINFCAITEQGRYSFKDTAYINYLIRLIKAPGYQTVLNGRPLWYFGFISPENVNATWGSFHNLKKHIDSVRKIVVNAGLQNPYLVIMDFDAATGKKWCDSLGADAISSYVAVNNTKLGTYQQLANQTANFWEECKTTGKQVVPVWDAGWNPLPRILHPTPWHIYPDKEYYTNATANELAQHFKNGLQWLKNNKEAAQAQCAIIYAWNEFDEGGWLCPTFNNNTERIDSIHSVLKQQ